MISLLLLAVALGTDAFSLCLGLALGGVRTRRAALFVILVACLHVVLPLGGWYLGRGLSLILERYSVYVAAGVLFYLAYKLAAQGLGAGEEETSLPDGPAALLLLALSVSLDSLSVGLVLSNKSYPLIQAALLFGLTAGLMSGLGFAVGGRLGRWAGQKAQVLGGLVLFFLGVKLLLHL